MDRALPLFVAFAGFFGGVVLFSIVGRWLYAIVTAVREYRSVAPGTVQNRRLASVLFPVVVLHSGAWALVIALVLSYYMLSRPYSPTLLWFFVGAGLGLLFMLGVVVRVTRRATALRVESAIAPGIAPGASAESRTPARPTIAEDSPEGNRLRMWASLWASLPGTVLLCTILWDSIVRAPELLIIVAVIGFVSAYVLTSSFRRILFPKPWRLPPRK